MKRKPQKQIILDWYKKRRWLGTDQMQHVLYISSPHRRLFELKEQGYRFEKRWKKVGDAKMREYKLISKPERLAA